MEEERDFLDMDEFYKKNIFLSEKKLENIHSKADIEQVCPGTFTYDWLVE
jgi:hypothetical protein